MEDDEILQATSPNAFDESWIVTKDIALKAVIASRGNKSRKNSRQPKGTKPRRWKGRKLSGSSCVEATVKVKLGKVSLDDTESTSSSIAIIPSPTPQSRPAGSTATASAILAASNDAKQLAAISSARMVLFEVFNATLSIAYLFAFSILGSAEIREALHVS